MEISLIADPKILLRHQHSILSAISDAASNAFHGRGILVISATAALPTDAISPPKIRSNYRFAPRTLTRKTRRTRRRTLKGGADDGGDNGFFGDSDGPFGGGSGSGRGGGGDGRWNFDRSGGSNWGESSYSDPAFDFVYEVLCWIVLSHCMHFGFKRIVRIAAEKFPMRLVPSVLPA